MLWCVNLATFFLYKANSVCKDLKRSSLSTKSLVRLLAGERTGKDMDGGEDTS